MINRIAQKCVDKDITTTLIFFRPITKADSSLSWSTLISSERNRWGLFASAERRLVLSPRRCNERISHANYPRWSSIMLAIRGLSSATDETANCETHSPRCRRGVRSQECLHFVARAALLECNRHAFADCGTWDSDESIVRICAGHAEIPFAWNGKSWVELFHASCGAFSLNSHSPASRRVL